MARAKQPYRRCETRVESAAHRNGIKALTKNPLHKLTDGRRSWPNQISSHTHVLRKTNGKKWWIFHGVSIIQTNWRGSVFDSSHLLFENFAQKCSCECQEGKHTWERNEETSGFNSPQIKITSKVYNSYVALYSSNLIKMLPLTLPPTDHHFSKQPSWQYQWVKYSTTIVCCTIIARWGDSYL